MLLRQGILVAPTKAHVDAPPYRSVELQHNRCRFGAKPPSSSHRARRPACACAPGRPISRGRRSRPGGEAVGRVCKNRTGRILDGCTWDGCRLGHKIVIAQKLNKAPIWRHTACVAVGAASANITFKKALPDLVHKFGLYTKGVHYRNMEQYHGCSVNKIMPIIDNVFFKEFGE